MFTCNSATRSSGTTATRTKSIPRPALNASLLNPVCSAMRTFSSLIPTIGRLRVGEAGAIRPVERHIRIQHPTHCLL